MNDRISYREPADEVIHLCRDCKHVQTDGDGPEEWACRASPVTATCDLVSGKPSKIWHCSRVRKDGHVTCPEYEAAPEGIRRPILPPPRSWWKFWK